MPIYGLRFKEVIQIATPKDDAEVWEAILEHGNRAEHIIYPAGKHDITPADYLLARWIHQLIVTSTKDEEDLVGKYKRVPRYQTDLALRSPLSRSSDDESQIKKRPVVLAQPAEHFKDEVDISLLVYYAATSLFKDIGYKIHEPEPRRDVMEDVLAVMKTKNERWTAMGILNELKKVYSVYKTKKVGEFEGLMKYLAELKIVTASTKASPTMYTLK